MITLKLALQNLRNFAKTKPLVFALYLICQVISMFAILTTFGTAKNYVFEKHNQEQNSKSVSFVFANATFGKIKESFLQAQLLLGDNLDYASLHLAPVNTEELDPDFWNKIHLGEPGLTFSFSHFKDGKLRSTDDILSHITEKKYRDLDALTPEDKVIIADSTRYPELRPGNTLEYGGITYKVIGKASSAFWMPIECISDNMAVGRMVLTTKKMITDFTLNQIVKLFTPENNEYQIMVYESLVPDAMNEQLYNLNIFVSVIIILLSALNFSILFRYILHSRRLQYAVMRITGCQTSQGSRIYLTEILLTALPVFLVCAVLFQLANKLFLSKSFLYFDEIFTLPAYLFVFLIYLVGIFLIFGISVRRFTRQSPVSLHRKG